MKEETINKIRQAGTVGAGGAGFPTHIKLSGKNIDTVIANGSECEPILSTDRVLMEVRAAELVAGLKLVVELTGASRGIIALKKHYHEAIAALTPLVASEPTIQLHLLNDYYPAGDEHTLVTDVTGRLVPEGGIPLNVGVLVNNVGTLVQVHNAVYQNEPVTWKHVTVAGEVSVPGVYFVPIGLSFDDLIAVAGGIKPTYLNRKQKLTIVAGGPMMGTLAQFEDMVEKKTGGIFVVPEDNKMVQMRRLTMDEQVKKARSACDFCTQCTQYCPRYLNGHRIEPHLVMRDTEIGKVDTPASFFGAFLCCFCNICALVCPVGLSPKEIFWEYRQQFRFSGVENPLRETPKAVRFERDMRMIPVSRLTKMLGLAAYDQHLTLQTKTIAPKKLRLTLSSNFGNPLIPLVLKGNRVNKNDVLATFAKDDSVNVPLHAPIDAKVESVTASAITLVDPYN